MIFPTFVVVLGALLVVCDAGATEALATMKAAHAKVFKGADTPNVFAKKAAPLTVTPETTYSSTGWMVLTLYADGNCGTAGYSSGYAVNTCFLDDGLGYKYQLSDNSCAGLVREDYSDDTCTTLSSTTPMLISTSCASSGGFTYRGSCTSSSTPSLPYQGMVMTYYREGECDAPSSMSAISANACMGTVMYTCTGDDANLVEYTDSDCQGTSTTYTYPATCMADTDDFADTSYGPGDHASNFTMACSAAVNGASGLLSNSLSVKAIAAIVVGAVAFLAF